MNQARQTRDRHPKICASLFITSNSLSLARALSLDLDLLVTFLSPPPLPSSLTPSLPSSLLPCLPASLSLPLSHTSAQPNRSLGASHMCCEHD